jgi:predicted signal transduction protein with EAL and GGDEF domain
MAHHDALTSLPNRLLFNHELDKVWDHATDLIRHAEAVMYRAKDEERNTYQFYIRDLASKAFERVIMKSELRKALTKKEFYLHYQPQIDLHTKCLIGLAFYSGGFTHV